MFGCLYVCIFVCLRVCVSSVWDHPGNIRERPGASRKCLEKRPQQLNHRAFMGVCILEVLWTFRFRRPEGPNPREFTGSFRSRGALKLYTSKALGA